MSRYAHTTFLLADLDIEKILRRLVGKTDVEDALSRLDALTKEESLMVVVRNLEVTHHVDGVVHEIDNNVKGIEGQVEGVAAVARSVDSGTQHFCLFKCTYRPLFTLYPNIVTHKLERLSLPDASIVDLRG